jgi:hypothetical protein
MSSSPSCPLVACRAAVIDVVEIWAGVNSDVAAEAEKTAVSIVWGRPQLSSEGGGASCVNCVDQECWMGGLLLVWVALSL